MRIMAFRWRGIPQDPTHHVHALGRGRSGTGPWGPLRQDLRPWPADRSGGNVVLSGEELA